MNRIDRLTAILIQLQSQRIIRAQTIANRFGISLRTVYRDVRALEAAGVPIGSEAGIGYFLADGYRLPPVLFTPDEARALLTAGKLVTTLTDASVQQPYDDALYKIKSVLTRNDQDMLEDLQTKMHVMTPPSNNRPADIHLKKIQEALVNRQVVRMQYFSPGSGQFTERTIEPIGMVYYGDAWHIIAYCQLRQDYRDFRLNRMSKLSLLTETYHLRDRLSLEQYLERQSQTTDATLMKVRFLTSVVPMVQAPRYQFGFVEETAYDDYTEMWFLVAQEEYFCRWLLMYGNAVEIVSPDRLHRVIRDLLTELTQHYRQHS